MEKLKTNRNVALLIVLSVINWLINTSVAINAKDIAWQIIWGTYLSPMTIIKTLVSLGISIYIFVVFWGVCKDINAICEGHGVNNQKKSPNYLVVALLSGITLGIYYLYWVYKQGNRLVEADQSYYKKGIMDNGGTYLLFYILGGFTLGICRYVFYAKLFKNLNILSEAYNEGQSQGNGFQQMDGNRNGIPVRPDQADDDSLTIRTDDANFLKFSPEGSMECCAGIYAGADIPVGTTELFIGRDESKANIVIKNPKISRCHCGIRYIPGNGNYMVTDYSTNGTFYKNGERFKAQTPTECRPGTIIVIAQSGNEFLLK